MSQVCSEQQQERFTTSHNNHAVYRTLQPQLLAVLTVYARTLTTSISSVTVPP
jgi:hypothetical protein